MEHCLVSSQNQLCESRFNLLRCGEFAVGIRFAVLGILNTTGGMLILVGS